MISQTKIWAEGIVCIALSAVLYSITLFTLPQGGRITAGSMIPILWFALRRGTRVGIFAGIVFGLVVLAIEPFIFHPIQVLLDYPIAFGLLGFAGLFKKLPLFGVGIGMVGRFLSHFVSGIIFFASYAPEGMNPAIYSALYNGSYILVEFIVSVIIILVLVKRKLLEIYQ
ncbi:energy-coupled thiamine transporter ThiT [[Eubacterium] cellulosolvens]